MKRLNAINLKWLVALGLLAGSSVGLAVKAGRFLVVDSPQPSDVILVVAGKQRKKKEIMGDSFLISVLCSSKSYSV